MIFIYSSHSAYPPEGDIFQGDMFTPSGLISKDATLNDAMMCRC